MKTIINIIALLLLSIYQMNAQQQNSITVFGETLNDIKIKEYIINIEFREIVSDNYRNVDGKTIDELKKAYASALSKVNIDFSQFEEDLLYRITSYSYNTSEFYLYQTSSLDEVQRILSQKMEGVTNVRVDILVEELNHNQIGELSKKAIEDAKNQAIIIASKLQKKIGKIITIENSNYRSQVFYSGRMKEPAKYQVKVTFLLEDK